MWHSKKGVYYNMNRFQNARGFTTSLLGRNTLTSCFLMGIQGLFEHTKGFYPIRNHCGYEVAIMIIICLQSGRKGNNNPTYKKIEICVYESGTCFVA